MINDNRAYNLRLKAASKNIETVQILQNAEARKFVLDKNTSRATHVRDKPEFKEYSKLINKASEAMRKDDYQDAIQILTNALKLNHHDPNVLIDRAECYSQIGKPELALKDLDVILLEQAYHPRALLKKADVLYASGDYKSALTFYEEGYSRRKDMAVFAIGIEKSKKALESAEIESVIQPNKDLEFEANKREILGDLSKDYDFLSELRVNFCADNDELKQKINEVLEFIDKSSKEVVISTDRKLKK